MRRERQKNLEELANEYIFALSKSKATTENMRAKAIASFCKANEIEDKEMFFIDCMRYKAQIEMKADIIRIEAIKKERKELRKQPLFARYYLANYKELRELYKKDAGEFTAFWIDEILKKIAFTEVFENSRLRKKFFGRNCHSAGIRTETNGRTGWDEVVWHYGDYTAIIDKSKHYIIYRSSNQKEFEIFKIFNSHLNVRGEIYKNKTEKKKLKLKVHTLRRFFNLAIPKNSSILWVWDREEKKGYYLHNNEKYHTVEEIYKTSREYFKEAVHAFNLRKKEQVAKEREEKIMQNLNRIFVEVADSVSAGNCKVETQRWYENLKHELGAEGDCAIRADVIFNRRNDNYARRAILQAALHTAI